MLVLRYRVELSLLGIDESINLLTSVALALLVRIDAVMRGFKPRNRDMGLGGGEGVNVIICTHNLASSNCSALHDRGIE